MKWVCAVIFLPILLLQGCSTPGSVSPEKIAKITLSQIEDLKPGVMTPAQVKAALGEPSEIHSLSSELEAWSYLEAADEGSSQRAGLVFYRSTGRLATATWVPGVTDPFRNRDAVLAHFRSAKFNSRDEGWIAKHYYSDEKIFEDQQRGISFRVHPVNQGVMAISFEQPISAQVIGHN